MPMVFSWTANVKKYLCHKMQMSFSWGANAKEQLCYKMPMVFSWTASVRKYLCYNMPMMFSWIANVKKFCYEIAHVVLMDCKCQGTSLLQNADIVLMDCKCQRTSWLQNADCKCRETSLLQNCRCRSHGLQRQSNILATKCHILLLQNFWWAIWISSRQAAKGHCRSHDGITWLKWTLYKMIFKNLRYKISDLENISWWPRTS